MDDVYVNNCNQFYMPFHHLLFLPSTKRKKTKEKNETQIMQSLVWYIYIQKKEGSWRNLSDNNNDQITVSTTIIVVSFEESTNFLQFNQIPCIIIFHIDIHESYFRKLSIFYHITFPIPSNTSHCYLLIDIHESYPIRSTNGSD